MDPLLFGIDAEIVGEVLGTVVLISLLVERFLSTIFEWRAVMEKIKGRNIKEPIAFGVSLLVIYFYQFDAMAIIFKEPQNSWLGYALTAGFIAGGSKGSMKLFRDYLGWKSSAQEFKDEEKKQKIKAIAPTPN